LEQIEAYSVPPGLLVSLPLFPGLCFYPRLFSSRVLKSATPRGLYDWEACGWPLETAEPG
jgi:hypothetical protein